MLLEEHVGNNDYENNIVDDPDRINHRYRQNNDDVVHQHAVYFDFNFRRRDFPVFFSDFWIQRKKLFSIVLIEEILKVFSKISSICKIKEGISKFLSHKYFIN